MPSGVGLRCFVNVYAPRSEKLSDLRPGAGSANGGVELYAERRRLQLFVKAYGRRISKLGDFRFGAGSAGAG